MSRDDAPTFRFEHEEHVRWVDLDAAGVVNNAVYATFLEQARLAYFRSLGLVQGERFPFLLGESTLRYLRPATATGPVTVAIAVTRLGTKSLDTAYEVRRAGEVLARARATLVWTDEHLQSAPIPDAARRAMEAAEGRPLG